MDDLPLTPEEVEILRHAQDVVAQYMEAVSKPQRLDVTALRCHPDDEAATRARFDAPFVIDPAIEPGHIEIVPHAYAKYIAVTLGFQNPEK